MREQPLIEEFSAPPWIPFFVFQNRVTVFTAIEVVFAIVMAEEIFFVVHDTGVRIPMSIMWSRGLTHLDYLPPNGRVLKKSLTTAFRALEPEGFGVLLFGALLAGFCYPFVID
jgi:hypothetical protein